MGRLDIQLFLIFLIVCSLVASGGCVSFAPLAPLERSLVYRPQDLNDHQSLDSFPGFEEVVYEDADFKSSDGTRLHGWFIEHSDPVAVALFFHGNGGNVATVAESLVLLNRRHRLSVMTFDYRGYGKSEGKPDERGILEDARAARRWLATRANIGETDIVLMGHSLGGGVAVDLAAKDGARALVLSNTFTSLPEVGKHHLPWLPTRLLMTQRLDSLSKISEYQGPLLQSHGEADRVIPYAIGRKLFEAANEPKIFVTLPGGGHNDPKDENYRKELDKFLAALQP